MSRTNVLIAINKIFAAVFVCFLFTGCTQKTTQLITNQPVLYTTESVRTVRVGEIIHSNHTKLYNSGKKITHELELGGIHQGYGASTVVNLFYRKRDENGNNIKRPKSVIHKLSDGNIVNLYGAKIEILEFDSNTITLVVKENFNQVIN